MELYYYTTAETMQFIMKNGDIFATHVNYLNDSEEYINGLRELRELLKRGDLANNIYNEAAKVLSDAVYYDAINNVPQIYSISFSEAPDLLSQWYMYSGESGVSLKFDFPDAEMTFQVKMKSMEEHDSSLNKKRNINSKIKKVHYFTQIGMEIEEYKKEINEIFKTIEEYKNEKGISGDIEGNIVKIWKEIAPYIKNYEFHQEQESRLIFNADVSENNGDLIEYRNGKGVLVPYLDIYMEKGWPIIEIMVGPGRNQERVFKSICHFVESQQLRIPEINQKMNVEGFLRAMHRYQIKQSTIHQYVDKVNRKVSSSRLITYKDALYECLADCSQIEKDYLKRNFYSRNGLIIRKSNAPYEF